jgi:hypothetical protein
MTALDVSLSTPGDWIVIRHGELADERDVDRLVGDRLDETPELAPYRDELVASVARTFARAEREGVVFAAIMAAPGPEGTPVLANLVVAQSAAPAPELAAAATLAGEGEPGLHDVERALDEPGEPGVQQRVVHALLLPGGPALRVARLSRHALLADGPEVTVLSVEYFFTKHELDQVFVLRFVSPSLAAHEELQALFHEIASTFSVGA